MNLHDAEDRVVASGQYVIGLLEESDRLEFEQALAKDAQLRAEVARWRDDLVGLTERVATTEPTAQLWNRIAQALPDKAHPVPVARPASPTKPATVETRGYWGSLGFWRTVSAVAVSIALILGGYIVQQPSEVRVYLAVLKSPDQQTGWLVKARTSGTIRLVPLDAATTIPVDKSLQLWTQPAGADAPMPIALVSPGQTLEIPLKQLPGLAGEQLFAISLEPQGGSPTGLPTGPILFAGNTEQL